MSGSPSGKARMSALVAALALVLAPLAGPVSPASAAGKPGVSLSRSEADGRFDHRDRQRMAAEDPADDAHLRAGRAVPGVIGGTNSCANADGRAVTTDAQGHFSKELPVTELPQPCPVRGARRHGHGEGGGRRDLHGRRALGRTTAQGGGRGGSRCSPTPASTGRAGC